MAQKTKIVVLAAGKGTRMADELPKVLVTLHGKPMIKYLLDAVKASGVDEKPIIVVGHKREDVMRELGDGYLYAVQEEQLGTGHAIMCTENLLKGSTENVMVLQSDHPFITPETIKKLAEEHIATNATITMATVKLPDFNDWRKIFYTNFGRIVRDKNNRITKIVEFKDASESEKNIKEVNPSYFCFEANWLWKNLKRLTTNNNQKQYYQTDLIKLAMDENEKIESIDVTPREGLAANSKEELEILERVAV